MRSHNNVQNIQQLACISRGIPEQSIRLHDLDVQTAQNLIFSQSLPQQNFQILLFQTLEHKNLTAGKQGSDDLKRRVFRSGPDQNKGPVLYCSEQSILLGLAEAVNLVYEENWSRPRTEQAPRTGFVNHFTHFLHTRTDRRKSVEFTSRRLGHNTCKRGFAHPRRSPKYERSEVAALNHIAQNAALTDKMSLPHITIQAVGTHSLWKRGWHYSISLP